MFDRLDPATIDWDALAASTLALGIAALAAFVLHYILFAVLGRIARLSHGGFDDIVLRSVRRPMRWAMIGWALSITAQNDVVAAQGWVGETVSLLARYLAPVLLGWVAYAMVRGVAQGLENQVEHSADPVAARGRRTRISILSRTIKVAIIVITVSLVMLNIPGVRDVGVTLMASAGLAALAIGAAAQPALKSLIAGLQMALTQPLRLGDLVKVDGEVGRVEEIRMSFVTVRTWDERVLIVPTSRFLDQSFENWSRVSEKLTGPVFLHLDPAAEIDPIRDEFYRYLEDHALFDGRNKGVLMTEARPESIELRLSMSAATIPDLWNLRCDVREHMLGWLRQNEPTALIRRRLEVEAANARAAG